MPIEGATTRFVGVDFSNLSWREAVAAVVTAADAPRFTSVVTPNVDHIVRMDKLGTSPVGQAYRAALADADYCFCDSRIVARLARMVGTQLHLVAGSDLTAEIFQHHLKAGTRIAIVGGDDETRAEIEQLVPGTVLIQHIPPMQLLQNPAAIDAAAQFIATARCAYIFIAVGSPQGEILTQRARAIGATRGVALSIGASIDFLTGRQKRAPKLMQKLGLEWLHRLMSNPKRLWRRYLVDGPRIFAIVMRRSGR